jgi:hypothetical protein
MRRPTHPDLRSAVKSWVRDIPRILPATGADHMHIDDLLKLCGQTSSSPIQEALDAYLILVDALRPRLAKIMPLVVISLRETSRLQIKAPDLSRLRAAMGDSPPSLFIVSRDSRKLLNNSEHYRRPLTFDPFEPSRRDIHFFYETFRQEIHKNQRRGYVRSVVGEHYPNFLIPGS